MKHDVLIIGANGSMGRRYQSILKYTSKSFLTSDITDNEQDLVLKAGACEGVIVATPTDTHYDILKLLAPLNKFTLCEKPITTNLAELSEIIELYKNQRLKMVMQYAELNTGSGGDSRYNYYNHGRDGLLWDCIQIIGLAEGAWSVGEESPVWICELNGKRLSLSEMDLAYITMIRKWFQRPREEMLKIYDIHKKVSEALIGIR